MTDYGGWEGAGGGKGGSREEGIQQRFKRGLGAALNSTHVAEDCSCHFQQNWNEDIGCKSRLSSPVRRPSFLLGFCHSKGGKVHPRCCDISNFLTSSTVFITFPTLESYSRLWRELRWRRDIPFLPTETPLEVSIAVRIMHYWTCINPGK